MKGGARLIDFQQIRQSTDIEEVAKWLGLEVRSGKARCPFHQDHTPSLSFKDGRYKCFGCDASGDAVDLVAKVRCVNTQEAVQQIIEAFHLDIGAPTPSKPSEFKEPHLQEYIDKTIEIFGVTRQAQNYLESRGFTGESMLGFRFGFDAGRNAIVIPYGSESAYYTSRSIADKRFFKPRTEDAGPEPLFYEESLDQAEPVFVVESAFCALSIMQEGGYAVSTCGTGAKKLIDALKQRASIPPLIICMDRDEAGSTASQKLCEQLGTMGIAHLSMTTPEAYKDPNELLVGDVSLFRTWIQDVIERAKTMPPVEQQVRRGEITVPPILYTLQPECAEFYRRTDIGNSNLFADFYKETVRYVPERKLWYVFDGKRWVQDTGNLRTMSLSKRLADILLVYAVDITDDDLKKKFIENCGKWQSRRTREIILKDAQDVYSTYMTEFDADPYLFNCQNGTLHLKTMEFLPHDAKDKLTKISQVVFDPSARCERFDAFVDEIMSSDRERADFLPRSLGYALSGDTRFECLFILYGATTRNGKGTLMESVLTVMGDYGSTVRPETISMKQNVSSQNPTEDIARLAGIRFANISEPSKGLLLNAAQVKSMTGNDTINARFLHENSFDFRPQFKIFMNTNYLPVITDITLFSSGRIMIIPFERHFEENEQDKTLKPLFRETENQSAILNWLLKGYRKLESEGLSMPQSVACATERYQHDSDKLALFLEEEMEPNANAEERTSMVYERYQKWCDANGCYSENMRNFKQALSVYGHIERKRPRVGGGPTTIFIGYRLRFDTGDFTDYKGKIPFD
jgi:P4 family phage/plasmid primase-like protien